MNSIRLRPKSSINLTICLLALSSLILAACTDGMESNYRKAVREAMMTAAKIPTELVAIEPENPTLQWENGEVGKRVLVVTYIDNEAVCKNYNNQDKTECRVGQECPNYSYNSWVSVAPELKKLLGTAPTLLRVTQVLGLPPPAKEKNLDNTCVLELYVSPSDLFRPSPDPDVTNQAMKVTPSSGNAQQFKEKIIYCDKVCSETSCSCTRSGGYGITYMSWFNNRRATIYNELTPYPWTALGYTYDWGSDSPTHIGVSEFVINAGRNGIPVFIRSATCTRQYFSNQ